ncbi:MAG TPA: prephenate dehydratase domain-containing protein [Polyangium sp.]|nr:prephenate dehydratase domain-containing protein [Polyangium sp.]
MDERKRLDELRAQLADLDHQILRQLERRARIAQDIIRQRGGTARFAPIADGPHLQALEQAVMPPLSPAAVREAFVAIDGVCRLFEVAPRVMFVGPEGGFGWMAARDHFGAGADLMRSDSVAVALEEVAQSRVEFAVVPYESLSDGPIFPTIQAIAATGLKLVGERELVQSLVLASVSSDATNVEKIYVAAQDHAGAAQYLQTNHPRAQIIDVRSPLAAIEKAEVNANSAALVPGKTLDPAKKFVVVRENIGDLGQIRMRYGVISRLPAPRSGADATALLFGVHDRPGALHELLHYFKDKNCNLRRIQSRPLPGEGWEYQFYVEVSGHVTDRNLVAALEGIKREAKMLVIVGSFPLERPERVTS